MEKPTRKASARAMLLVLGLPFLPSVIMKYSAEPRLARMATKPRATRIFMAAIILPGPAA